MRNRRPLIVAALLFLAYVLLGVAVAHPIPDGFDAGAEARLVGEATPFAAFLTSLGRFPAYGTECVLVVIAGVVRRAWLGRSLTAVGLLLVAWITSDTLKNIFARPRPSHWLVTHETSYSYASGHATNSIAFFGFWAYVAWCSQLPAGVRTVVAVACVTLSLAIGWSRLALGAHYPSDVAGGYLLGIALLEVALALVPASVLQLEPAEPALRRRAAAAGR